jgi:hypothetical protein
MSKFVATKTRGVMGRPAVEGGPAVGSTDNLVLVVPRLDVGCGGSRDSHIKDRHSGSKARFVCMFCVHEVEGAELEP